MIQNIHPPTELELQKISVGQTMTLVLVPNIDVSRAREVTLVVRVHAFTGSGTGTAPSLSLALAPVAPMADGFPYGGPAPVVTTVVYNQSTPTANTMVMASNISGSSVTPVGGYVTLAALATQYGTTVTTHKVTISVDLVLKG